MKKIDNARYTPWALLKSAVLKDLGWGQEFVKGNIHVNEDRLAEFLFKNRGAKSLLPYFRGKNSGSDIHYNLPVEFYERLLGPTMAYTCANYYGGEGFTLETAQLKKFNWHKRRLLLHSDCKILECGSGFGSFRKHIHSRVKEYQGLTISSSQQSFVFPGDDAQDDVLVKSWEDFTPSEFYYDRFVSIGMLEHVGKRNAPKFFEWVRRCLTRNGLGTFHFISRDKPISPWADKYIFPGAEPLNFNEVSRLMRLNNLSITDTREGGADYVLTLKAWLNNLESNQSWIVNKFGLMFYRTFLLYLNGGICSFESGDSQLMQVAFEVSG